MQTNLARITELTTFYVFHHEVLISRSTFQRSRHSRICQIRIMITSTRNRSKRFSVNNLLVTRHLGSAWSAVQGNFIPLIDWICYWNWKTECVWLIEGAREKKYSWILSLLVANMQCALKISVFNRNSKMWPLNWKLLHVCGGYVYYIAQGGSKCCVRG